MSKSNYNNDLKIYVTFSDELQFQILSKVIKSRVATTIEITTTIEIIISIVIENEFKFNFASQPLLK